MHSGHIDLAIGKASVLSSVIESNSDNHSSSHFPPVVPTLTFIPQEVIREYFI